MAPFKANTIIQEAKDLSKYGKDFQVKLLALLVKDRVFSFSIIPIIKDVYFSDIYLRTVFVCVKDYIETYYSCPTFDNLRILLQAKGEKLTTYDRVLTSIDGIGLEDRDFIIDNTRSFCFTKHALVENDKMVAALKDGQFEAAKKIAVESFQHSGLESARVIDLKTDIDKVHQSETMRVPMPIMFETYNQHSKGGISGGEICIVVAPSNFGKSNFLVSVARHLNFTGKNVVFFSYEMTAESLVEKYMAGLLDINQNEVKNYRKEIGERLKDSNLGGLKIIEDKAANATLAAMQTQLEYLKSTSFFADAIIIDGLNQLKLPRGVRSKDDNEKYEMLTEGLKDMCKELGLPAWACWQTNRSGFGDDINGINSIGKAIEVFQKADQVITFSQPGDMKINNECVAYLLKNRLGQKEIAILCHYDPGKVLFVEREVINARVFMSDKEKKVTTNTVEKIREKIKTEAFLKKS
jgi:archaellum biogenesis ATPase FlaH